MFCLAEIMSERASRFLQIHTNVNELAFQDTFVDKLLDLLRQTEKVGIHVLCSTDDIVSLGSIIASVGCGHEERRSVEILRGIIK